MPDGLKIRDRFARLSYIGAVAGVALALYLSSLYSYILFHSLIEIVTIAVAFTLFVITWNTREYLANGYLRLLGIGYGFIALIDLVHTLAYKGMAVFPEFGANLPTQLWIAARYLQAVTLLAAPFFVERRVNDRAVLGVYAATVSVLLAMVYSGNFPDCFIEGKGLTTFKIGSEYLISALLLISLYLFYRERDHFKGKVYFLAAASIVCTVISELSFTAYVSVYGFANLIGHFAKLAAFYLIYRAILVTGLKEPFDLIFRDLKRAEEALQRNQDTLEEKVRERTAALDRLNRELRAISDCNEVLMRAEDEQTLLNDICRIVCDEAGYRLAWVGYAEHDDARTVRPVAWAGVEDGYLATADITWADVPRGRGPTGIAIRTGKTDCIGDFATEPKAEPWRERALQRGYRSTIALPLKDESKATFGALTIYSTEANTFTPDEVRLMEELSGDLAFGIVVLRARIGSKRAEEALRRLNRELRAISECNQTLMRAEDEQPLLDDICRIVCDEAGYRMAWVGYAGNDDGRTIRPVAWAGAETEYLQEAHLTWADTERGRGPAGTTIRSGESNCIQDFTIDPRGAPWRGGAAQRGYRSSIALPLKDEAGHTFGVLSIYSSEPNAFTPDEIRLLNELSADLAFGIAVLRARIERGRAEEEVLKLNQELEQRVADRTAELESANKELEAFAYSVSHDLRAPLRHIDGFLSLLKEKMATTLDEESRHYMTTISDAARRMSTLIDDLLSFSRMGRNEMAKTQVDLGALVREVIRDFEPETRNRVVDWRIAELPVVTGDRAMLRVVLVNLSSNALKFTRPRAQAEIEIGCLPDQETEVIVFVRDNGVGFDMKYVDKLFGVFQRLHGVHEFEGTGIGLANVRRIIGRHGGRAWAEGKVDGGATLYFSLPITKENNNES